MADPIRYAPIFKDIMGERSLLLKPLSHGGIAQKVSNIEGLPGTDALLDLTHPVVFPNIQLSTAGGYMRSILCSQ